MKKRLILILIGATQVVFAGNLETSDGTHFQNVTIISADHERLLIVHNGGACQIEYSELAPGTLSPEQRLKIENKLTEYTERKERIEKLQLEKNKFEQAQRKKGLIQFEDSWMKPLERDELLARREIQKLEKERLRLELEKQKAELLREQQLAEQGDRLLEPDSKSYIFYSNGPGIGTAIVSSPCHVQNTQAGTGELMDGRFLRVLFQPRMVTDQQNHRTASEVVKIQQTSSIKSPSFQWIRVVFFSMKLQCR